MKDNIVNSSVQVSKTMLDYALEYSKWGLAIFPIHSVKISDSAAICSCGNEKCSNPGKHPRTSNGFKGATTDIEVVQDWWKRWPDANIGIATGPINDILVLDVDPIHGGNESLKELEKEYGSLPITPTVKTGSDGRHFMFFCPSSSHKNVHGFKPGLDIKCEGGYVVAAPSIHRSGNRYQWIDGFDIFSVHRAECPSWLLDLVEERSEEENIDTDEEIDTEIKEGRRNETLFKLGCKLKRRGLNKEELFLFLMGKNQAHCKPPLDELEIKQITKQCVKMAKSKNLMDIVSKRLSLFHDVQGKAYATIDLNGHQETYSIQARQFKDWVSKEFYDETKGVLTNDTKKDVLAILEARAKFEGPTQEVAVRVGGNDERVFVDLANENWEVVEIDRHGWRVLKGAPIKFIRSEGMLPLPNPEAGGHVNLLRPYLNLLGDEDWALLLGWLVSSLRPKGPYLINTFIGEQGCAKSTQSKLLRDLIDPYRAPLRDMPNSVRDLFITASKSWVQAFDNLSGLSNTFADALCRLSTGGGLSTRKLHTDDEEIIFEVMRPTLMNGITEASSRPDLIDRSLLIGLPVIPKENRKREKELWESFNRDKPKILGAIFSSISCAIRNLGTFKMTDLPRMADVVEWVTAAESELGLNQGAFLKAYNSNKASAIYDALEASSVAAVLEKFMEQKSTWTGQATILLHHLTNMVDKDDIDKKEWPKNGQRLSHKLKRIAPGLREKGLNIEWERDGKARNITITKIDIQS